MLISSAVLYKDACNARKGVGLVLMAELKERANPIRKDVLLCIALQVISRKSSVKSGRNE